MIQYKLTNFYRSKQSWQGAERTEEEGQRRTIKTYSLQPTPANVETFLSGVQLHARVLCKKVCFDTKQYKLLNEKHKLILILNYFINFFVNAASFCLNVMLLLTPLHYYIEYWNLYAV